MRELHFLYLSFEFLSHCSRHAATPGDQRGWWVREGDMGRGLTANKRIGGRGRRYRVGENRWLWVRDKGNLSEKKDAPLYVCQSTDACYILHILRTVWAFYSHILFYTAFPSNDWFKLDLFSHPNSPPAFPLFPLHLLNPHLCPWLLHSWAIPSSHPPTSLDWTLLHCLVSLFLAAVSSPFLSPPQTVWILSSPMIVML